ncbi:MAG: DUF368 domain-containing protein [Actinomycetia bacterium]|nr:DUF368 domain-containing protein [Actinomycetes bacterium]
MGAADIVPGVSGGTVALVLGIYEDLLANIRQGARALGRLVKGDRSGFAADLRKVDWTFLIPLLAGIGLAVIVLTSVIEHLLEEQPVRTASVFFGLVVGSMVVAWRMVDHPIPTDFATMGGVAVVSFFLLGLRSGPVSDPAVPLFFAAGAIAICAMILPGISGSFLLLMMGMYTGVLDAVHDRDLASLGVFLVGAVVGLALFSSVLDRALHANRNLVLAALIGLMLGSLRVLWPWPDGVGSPDAGSRLDDGTIVEGASGTTLGFPEGDVLVPIVLGVGALALVLVVSEIGRRRDARATAGPAA